MLTIKYKMRWLLIGGLCLSSTSHAGEVIVTIEGATPMSNVYVGLHHTANGFPHHPLQGRVVVATDNGHAKISFEALPAGKYALSSYADLNGNGQLDTNVVGIPNEPYGFSEAAMGLFGAPKFTDACFSVPEQGAVIQHIHLK